MNSERRALYADAVNLAAEQSPFGHPLPEAELRAAHAGVDAALAYLDEFFVALLKVRQVIEETCLLNWHAQTWSNHAYRPVATLCAGCEAIVMKIEETVATVTDDFERRSCVCRPGTRCALHASKEATDG